jgi:hypothetical protein
MHVMGINFYSRNVCTIVVFLTTQVCSPQSLSKSTAKLSVQRSQSQEVTDLTSNPRGY